MLVFTRKIGEAITIGHDIVVRLEQPKSRKGRPKPMKSRAWFSIDCPPDVRVGYVNEQDEGGGTARAAPPQESGSQAQPAKDGSGQA